MRPRQFVAIGALGGTIALAGWGAAKLGTLGSLDVENAATTTRGAMSLNADAKTIDASLKSTPTKTTPTDMATSQPALPGPVAVPAAVAPAAVVDVPISDPAPRDPEPRASSVATAAVPATDAAAVVPDASGTSPESPSSNQSSNPLKTTLRTLASLFTAEPPKELPKPVVRAIETPNECLVVDICVDDYLWSLYQRAPKVDTNKVVERFKVKVKTKKGKTKTVTKTTVKYVVGDFTWKDPIAAQKVGMSLKDYVIGGMDRSFKLKLFRALQAVEEAGLQPGITSAFRDNYRQSIAVGNTASSDSSYHGGSRRGGYGHGMAVDLVSVKGETRMQRYASSDEMWKWIDAREKDLGVGRPYLDRDPPHIGPIDGREFVDKRGGRSKVQMAALATKKKVQKAEVPAKKKHAQATKADAKKRMAAHKGAKRAKPAKSSRTASAQH
jgi:hypothetical protein